MHKQYSTKNTRQASHGRGVFGVACSLRSLAISRIRMRGMRAAGSIKSTNPCITPRIPSWSSGATLTCRRP